MKALVLVLVVVGGAGCQPRCDPSYCTGNTLHLCQDGHDEDPYWQIIDCTPKGLFCVAPGGTGFCADEPTPRAACEGRGYYDGATCDGSDWLRCLPGGYAEVQACGAPELCEASVSKCLIKPGVDPTCATRRPPAVMFEPSYCDGASVIECEDVYAIEATDCGTMPCHQSTATAACVVSATPDPACPIADSGWPYWICDTATRAGVRCIDRYRIKDFPCGPSGTCVLLDNGATVGCR